MTQLAARRWVVLVIAAAAALYLWPITRQPQAFPFAPGAAYSDVLIAHLSSAQFLRRAVATWGEIPLWNPTLLSGMPFAADPLSGLWYPPLWALAAIPTAAVVNLIFWAHVALAGCGMTLLLRSEKLSWLSALIGGLAFAGMPKLVGHVGLGHLTLVSAVSWSPWLLLAVGRAVERSGQARHWRSFLALGFVAGLVFLVDPRWFPMICVASVAYGAWRWSIRPDRAGRATRDLLTGLAGSAVAFAAIAAALAVPLAEFVNLSTRGQMSAAAADVFSLPVARLVGFLVAVPGTWAEWLASTGSVALILAVAGGAGLPRRVVFWIALTLAALILALGSATPLGRALSAVPGFDLTRVPARWLFFAGMGIAALAGYGLSAIEGEADAGVTRRIRLATLFAALVVLGVTAALNALSDLASWSSALFAVLALAGVWLRLRGWRPTVTSAALTALLVIELFSIDVTLVEARPAEDALAQGQAVAARLAEEGDGRTFSLSYAVPQEAAAEAGLELADGVHPLQLSAYVTFMSAAAGFDSRAYSVTLPPFPSGDPTDDWGPVLDMEALGLLAIERVASTFPVEAPGLASEGSIDGVLLYRNERARPMAWIEPPEGLSGPIRSVTSLSRSANRVEIVASGPGLLVLSDPMYPGWTATVDGVETPIRLYRGLLRSVALADGEHSIVFRFGPSSLYAGMAIAAIAAVAAFVLWRRS
jgi:hypothetical protein